MSKGSVWGGDAVILMWLCLGWGATALAAPAPLTLSEAMLLALKHNPALAAAGLAVETAEADMAKARARFLPTVNFNETYNYSNNPTQVFMNKLNQRVFTGQDFLLNNLNYPNAFGDFRTGLVLRQPLFQAGEATLGYQQARLGREMAARLCPERPAAAVVPGDPGLFRVAAGPGKPDGGAAGQSDRRGPPENRPNAV